MKPKTNQIACTFDSKREWASLYELIQKLVDEEPLIIEFPGKRSFALLDDIIIL